MYSLKGAVASEVTAAVVTHYEGLYWSCGERCAVVDPMQCGSVAQPTTSSHSLLLKVLWSQFGRWKNYQMTV